MRALPFGPTDARFWRFYRLAIPVYRGRGTAGQHKQVYDILVPALHADPTKAPELVVDPGVASQPAPPRAVLIKGAPAVKNGYLSAVTARTLIAVGSEDAIVPVALAQRVCGKMPDARLVVFDRCGHYPQHETPDVLASAVSGFLA
jgi:pimeloyl-ACP methyl ester carboxylesterase